MPLIDSNDSAYWVYDPQNPGKSLYRVWELDPVTHRRLSTRGYERMVKDRIVGTVDIDRLIAPLVARGMTKGQRIVIVGCGFGWVTEYLIAQGWGPVGNGTSAGRIVSVDTSTWIQANKSVHAVVPVVNAEVNASTGRRTIRQQLGNPNITIDWCITEDVLPILAGNDTGTGQNEYGPFASACRQVATNVAHWVTCEGNHPELNWKSLATWTALMAPDVVIERPSGRVI